MKIEVYSDGSGNTFDSDGGYGYRIVVDGKLVSEGSGYLLRATNNVAEITAAIKGLERCKQLLQDKSICGTDDVQSTITLISDSQLVLGYASGRYQCKALHLASLYIALRKIYQELKVDTRWVRGHSGDEHNEACDKLAKIAREGKGENELIKT